MLLNGKKSIIAGSAVLAALSYAVIPTVAGKIKYFTLPKEGEKCIYLTFDDGPSAKYTGKLLDLLKKYDIKASFFVVADFAFKNPSLIKRMQDDGHLIGFHSFEHKSALLQTPAYTDWEFEKSMKIFRELDVKPKYYRPPWGEVNIFTLKNLKKYGLKKVIWQVMAEDWRGNTTAEIIEKKLLRRTKSGDVVCLHDGRGSNEAPSRTIKALEKTIPIWLEKGFKFKKINEK